MSDIENKLTALGGLSKEELEDNLWISLKKCREVTNMVHGSFLDRGAADSYYGRIPNPHRGGVGGDSGPFVKASSQQEVDDYMAGYRFINMQSEKKETK